MKRENNMNMIDKKSLIRHYKENPPSMGVYLITNVENGKKLLGVSENIAGKFNRIRMELKSGVSTSWLNSLLQADWNQFGEQSFRFEILDTLEPDSDPSQCAADELKTLLSLWQENLPDCEYNTSNM